MLTNESLERQLDGMLDRYHVLFWKELGLKALIKNAKKEKEIWEARNNRRITKIMSRIIKIAEILRKRKEKASKLET